MTLPLLPTTVIGSLPKPAWLTDAWYTVAERWHLEGAVLTDAQEDATRLALLDQLRAGIDIVCDGEPLTIVLLADAAQNAMAGESTSIPDEPDPPPRSRRSVPGQARAHRERRPGQRGPARRSTGTIPERATRRVELLTARAR